MRMMSSGQPEPSERRRLESSYQAGRVASMEFREAGMIIEPWPAATPTRALSVVARIAPS